MAAKGAKPKPAHLRIVDGTHRPARHGKAAEAKAAADQAASRFGKIDKPKHLTGDASSAWDRWIVPAFWLDASREAAAVAFCELWKEFRFNPMGFPASKHGQLRAYMADLGLTDERNRLLDDGKKEKDPFFD